MLTDTKITELIRQAVNKRRAYTRNRSFDYADNLWQKQSVKSQVAQAVALIKDYKCESKIEETLKEAWDFSPTYFGDALADIEDALEIALDTGYKRLLILQKAGEADGQKPQPPETQKEPAQHRQVNVAPTDLGLAEISAQFLRWHMERDGYVQWFRQSFSKGRLLNEEQCWARLTHPILRVLNFDELEQIGVLPADVVGRQVSGGIELKSERVQAEFEMTLPNGLTISKKYEKSYQPGGPEKVWKQSLYSRVIYRPHYAAPSYAEIPYYLAHGINLPLQTLCTSVVSEALSVADLLSDSYRIDLWDALRFLLTGKPPALRPVTACDVEYQPRRTNYDPNKDDVIGDSEQFRSAGPVGLMILPWLMPKDVADYWRDIRPKAARARKMPSSEYLSMFLFVLENAPPGDKPCWVALAEGWNNSQGNKCTVNAFRRAFLRVCAALFPGYDARS